MNEPVDVIFAHPGGRGWAPVTRLAVLAARCLEARLLVYDYSMRMKALRLADRLLPRRRGGARRALVIAPTPSQLAAVLEVGPALARYDAIAAWVIDSFWWERIPGFACRGGRFDHLYVTDHGDRDVWCNATGVDVSVLPWGTETLGVLPQVKTVDLLRLGRQPEEWNDDEVTRRELEERGFVFGGRPPFAESDLQSQSHVDQALAQAKFVLAFSNQAHTSAYTHPLREYITARWVDSLAQGAIVAGVPPESAASQHLLWEGATLDLGGVSRSKGLERLALALHQWTPSMALRNSAEARRRLDWRHRLKTIAQDLEICPCTLNEELVLLGADASAEGGSDGEDAVRRDLG
jgi:hypothetical protein